MRLLRFVFGVSVTCSPSTTANETLMRMGKTEAEVYQYTDLTDNQKKKLMIADNKIFSLGIENHERN